MTAARTRAVGLAALACGVGVVALLLASDHQGAKTIWGVFGPAVGWSFIGVGLYAWRRRLERNLHDGAQQRLVSLALQLRMVEGSFDANPDRARRDLTEAREQLTHALEELRELARGIHPAILTDGGLARALPALAHRAPVPVEINDVPDERLPEPVEAAAYYLIAEAITNVAKHAQASHVAVSVRREGARVLVQVADDGVGGADPVAGSGLHGLADRVEALHGQLRVDSPPGGDTRLEARIPVG